MKYYWNTTGGMNEKNLGPMAYTAVAHSELWKIEIFEEMLKNHCDNTKESAFNVW